MRNAALALVTVLTLTGVLAITGALAADSPKDAKTSKVAAAGILTDVKPDSAMIWIDGQDSPVKFAFGEGFDKKAFGFPPAGKGIFTVSRVQVTYAKGDGGDKLLTIKKEQTPARGTVTGVVQFSNDFWVAVKPKVGPMDGYAINWPPGEMVAKLKALKKGDTVTVKFHTDFERHRIDALQVAPASPPPSGSGGSGNSTPPKAAPSSAESKTPAGSTKP